MSEMDGKKGGLSLDLKVSGVMACLMSEGSEFRDLAAKQENERSPLVLRMKCGTVSISVFSKEQRDLDGQCRCKKSKR